jgi:16S rRNA (cytosine1402-N4)-methyltransferase
MTAGSGSNAVAGGSARHIPVLARRAIDWLAVKPGGVYVDATFGGGGYARAILHAASAHVIGIDRDPVAISQGASLAAAAEGRLTLWQDRFSNLDSIVGGTNRIDGIVFDLGVSSMQLDEAARGFSFRLEGPLDMRMSGAGPTAADVIARVDERELAAIIAELGEEQRARAIARAIVRARAKAAIESTRALAEILSAVVPARDRTIHPATRTFQALRIFVNSELSELAQGLAAAERVLKPAGRLVVVAFHSLEDRIVKNFLTGRSRGPSSSRHRPEVAAPPPTLRVLTRRPETPDQSELLANPRARSAKLRAAERTEAPARGDDLDDAMPRLPRLADIMRGSA